MSAAAASASEPAPPAKGKKKLIIIIAGVVALVLVGGGAGTVLVLKNRAAAAAAEAEAAESNADDGERAPKSVAAKHDPKSVPVFVPLDLFTVNLANREAERYAQLSVTLEIEDAKIGDQIKNHMPAIRNHILLAIADRTAEELLGREGKLKLAEMIKLETARALGYEVPAEEDEAGTGDKPASADPKARKKKKSAEAAPPVKAVHFSNFIIQ